MISLYKLSAKKLMTVRCYSTSTKLQFKSPFVKKSLLRPQFIDRGLSGSFKDRERALENQKVREHEEKLIRELREELRKREEKLAKEHPESELNQKQPELSLEEQLEQVKKQLEEANAKIRELTQKK